jgi:uncharacterized damage-inducible protein DinB
MRIPTWVCLAVPLIAQTQSDRNLLPLDEFVKDWEISRQFTLDVAALMPAEKYGFKAAEPEMSFGSLMMHIAGSSVYRFAQISGEKPPAWVTTPAQKLTKQQILERLAQSFDYVLSVLPKLTAEQLTKLYEVDWKGRPQVNGRQMMLNMFVHVAHHRAQAEVYLRMNGIAPPAYTF